MNERLSVGGVGPVPARFTIGRWAGGAVFVALVAASVIACGSTPATDPRAQEQSTVPGTARRLEWAGFTDTSGLEILALDETTGIDTMVAFVLSGSSTHVDRALSAANFDTEVKPGIGIVQPPLPGFGLTTLSDPHSAEDRWVNASGQSVVRLVVRGETSDGEDQLHVWAFTT